jgi:hypothetical protein
MTRTSERLSYAGLTVAIICAGLLCRSPALGLPWPAAKYSGSELWAATIYASLRAINPRASILGTLEAAIAIAICVEFSLLYHQPELDSFRTTLAGQLLLGRIFSLWNVVAYAAGIACIALADGWVRRIRERQRTASPGR